MRRQRALASANHSSEPNSPWPLTNSWGLPETKIGIKLQTKEINLAAEALPDLSNISIVETQYGFDLFTPKGFFHCAEAQPDLGLANDKISGGGLRAPMHGTVVTLQVEAGGQVKKGDSLLVMEAMKMEHSIKASEDGVISELFISGNDQVENGALLMVLDSH